MRKTYESVDDLKHQSMVASVIEDAWKCKLVKTPAFYQFDYTITRGIDVMGFCEIKVRNRHCDTLLLSLHKWVSASQCSKITKLPFFLVAKTPEGIFWVSTEAEKFEVVIGGRKDRNYSQDMEPCILIPFSRMKKFDVPKCP
jgi:hypothetical protein